MSVTVMVVITDCKDCRHNKIRGYGKGNKPLTKCTHPELVYPDSLDINLISDSYNIPDWCPLKSGAAY